jgi:hypothetical protein
MYMEDDWELQLPSDAAVADSGEWGVNLLSDALSILQRQGGDDTGLERVAEVVLQDQGGGWARVSRPSARTDMSSVRGDVAYRLHEFAVSDPAHKLAWW